MKQNIPLYVLTVALLAVSVYLQSSVIAVAIVALWGVHAGEIIMTRKNRDADIADMMATMASHKAQMNNLSKDITNVAERAKVILGDTY